MPVGVPAGTVPAAALLLMDRAAACCGCPYPPREGGLILREISDRTGVPEAVLCAAAIARGYWKGYHPELMAVPIPVPADPELAELLEALR